VSKYPLNCKDELGLLDSQGVAIRQVRMEVERSHSVEKLRSIHRESSLSRSGRPCPMCVELVALGHAWRVHGSRVSTTFKAPLSITGIAFGEVISHA
jgi:hypothetical protein